VIAVALKKQNYANQRRIESWPKPLVNTMRGGGLARKLSSLRDRLYTNLSILKDCVTNRQIDLKSIDQLLIRSFILFSLRPCYIQLNSIQRF
jgi:hypothetical protein